MKQRTAYIRSVGRFLPERKLTNSDLEKMVETSDDWIVTRTGIRERRILEPGLGCSHMAVPAAIECLERAGVSPEEVDLIIVGTVTPDMLFPSTACLVQDKIGAKNAWGFDLSAGCSGFLFSLSTASQLIESGKVNRALVIGSDVISTIIDYTDRSTCVIFGDGAGAVLLEACDEPGFGLLDFMLKIDGGGGEYLCVRGGGSRIPPSHESIDNREHYVTQDGRQVFKASVSGMSDVSVRILEKNGLTGKDITLFVPHQANKRIIDATAERAHIEEEKIVVNIDKYGNTVAASIPLALYEALVERDYDLKKGDYLLMSAFGAGFTWGSALMRWWGC
ncbi:MAG: ketoacyl-ACP synthase III [Deltaproteobacteria bacterium]|jgi:3-oxoacyl-[acyl-carrier-protein] synthase-3|nr:ketoacyl-ACP synthase III [Deltaproteobacteria bacterium]